MVSAINFSLKYNLSAFTGSAKFHSIFWEILKTDLKLHMIVDFKETWIRVVLKKKLDEVNRFMFSPQAPPTHREICESSAILNRTPWNESSLYNWWNDFEKGFRTAWLSAETSGWDEPREPCPTVKLLFMHFPLPEAAEERCSVFPYTLWVAGTNEVDIRYLPINKSPGHFLACLNMFDVQKCRYIQNARLFKLELSFKTIQKRVSICISMKSPRTSFTGHSHSPPLIGSGFELDVGLWRGITLNTILMELTVQ